ncbi:hypothetical protein KIW84_054325 [Lathyrus oleraceus]|uniref:Uncharacterized protein n=1 Tax=Pisum sativum TaxID=3888 RepID=A0A9D4WU25_PEA|nr:hypothetical protein KIW84_054325 [Pisum sativum]
METNYASDELGSSDPDASDQESGPRYPRFKMEEPENNYKFKVGLEFVSLDEFKEANTEWSANSKGIDKHVVAKMASYDGIKIRDIVSDIRP